MRTSALIALTLPLAAAEPVLFHDSADVCFGCLESASGLLRLPERSPWTPLKSIAVGTVGRTRCRTCCQKVAQLVDVGRLDKMMIETCRT